MFGAVIPVKKKPITKKVVSNKSSKHVFTVDKKLVDRIDARVNGVNVLRSDLILPRIDKEGGAYTLEEVIDQELMVQKAVQRKLLPSATDVEKRIAAWKAMHRMGEFSEEELEERLKKDGLTLKQYKAQLFRYMAVDNLRQLEMSERVVITSQEIEEYYKWHPKFSSEQYLLKTAIIPFDKADSAEEAAKVKDLEWLELDWINKDDLADNLSFVSRLKVGRISRPFKVEQGYQLVKLMKKDEAHQMTVDERWGEIEKELHKQKTDEFEKGFIKELRSKASIIYL